LLGFHGLPPPELVERDRTWIFTEEWLALLAVPVEVLELLDWTLTVVVELPFVRVWFTWPFWGTGILWPLTLREVWDEFEAGADAAEFKESPGGTEDSEDRAELLPAGATGIVMAWDPSLAAADTWWIWYKTTTAPRAKAINKAISRAVLLEKKDASKSLPILPPNPLFVWRSEVYIGRVNRAVRICNIFL
jgi:hypothetical protein